MSYQFRFRPSSDLHRALVQCPRILTVATVLISLLGPAATAGADENPALQDARLNSVYFVDAAHGWAVGDRGVIWHTDDGGAHWALQPSGTVCALQSVWFTGDKTGWIARDSQSPDNCQTR